MSNFVVELWDDEGSKCTFYTVRWDEAETNETDKLFSKYENESSALHHSANELLLLILDVIGDKYGALDDFFDRMENNAQALPPRPKRHISEIYQLGVQFPLRLYCYRISETIVVLFGGGRKSAATSQASEVSMQFIEAQQFSKSIEEALREGTMLISEDQRYLTDFQNNHEIFLSP